MQSLDFPPEMFPDLVTLQPAGRSQDEDDAPPARGPMPACVQKDVYPAQRTEGGGLVTGTAALLVTFPSNPNAGLDRIDPEWLDTDGQIIWHVVPGDPAYDRIANVKDEPLHNTATNTWDVACEAVS